MQTPKRSTFLFRSSDEPEDTALATIPTTTEPQSDDPPSLSHTAKPSGRTQRKHSNIFGGNIGELSASSGKLVSEFTPSRGIKKPNSRASSLRRSQSALSKSAPDVSMEVEQEDATTPEQPTSINILESYISRNSKGTAKWGQALKDQPFLLKPSTLRPVTSSTPNHRTSNDHKNLDPILSQSKKLIGNNAIVDVSQSSDTVMRKTGEVVDENPQLRPKTIILDNITQVESQPQIHKRFIKGHPGLFALSSTILPTYQQDRQRAQESLEQYIERSMSQKTLPLNRSEIVLPGETPMEKAKRDKSYPDTKVDDLAATQDQLSERKLQATISSFCDIMTKVTDGFYNSTSIHEKNLSYDIEYIKKSLSGEMPEEGVAERTIEGIDEPIPTIGRNPNLRTPDFGRLVLEIPKLFRVVLMKSLTIPVFPYQRHCKKGAQCEGINIWNKYNANTPIKQLNKMNGTNPHKIPEEPFILAEFLLPNELEWIMSQKRAGRSYADILTMIKPRYCLLCLRLHICQLVNYQKANIEKKTWYHVQNHSVAFDIPGEYKKEYMLGCNGEWTGCVDQILTYNTNHYVPGNYYVWYVEQKMNGDGSGASNTSSHTTATTSGSTVVEKMYKTHTTPIPRGNGQDLMASISSIMEVEDYVYQKIVPGILEIEEIVYQPEITQGYVRNLLGYSQR